MKIQYKSSAYPPPFLQIQKRIMDENHFFSPKKVEVCEYYTLSDGCRKMYTDEDALKEYSSETIFPPCEVSYYNLFINGVLQPPSAYCVEKGKLILKTADIPIRNAPIILQMIKL
ncbi:DUF4183 domain-containing protein [Peribacillus faecalis]|nr:DUF4183 domain-containing protein [Peribacillus faecalis]